MSRNNEYWKSRDGELYGDQQRVRRAAGNENYARQEQWLSGFLVERSEALGRPVRVLDFGVGFGRLAHVLSAMDNVDYYGYDISDAMVAPLLENPPERLAGHINDRIRVGPSLFEAMAGCTFDVIFTVSVLIHNDRDQAGAILAQMRSLLAPEGRICLIENRPVSISLMANLWHNGCWSHDVAGTLAADMNVDVEDGILSDHGIYILSEPASPDVRKLRVPGENGFSEISVRDYLDRCRWATQALAHGLESEVLNVDADIARLRDASELYQQAEAAAVAALGQARDLLADQNHADLRVEGTHLTSAIAAVPTMAALLAEHVAARRDELAEKARQQLRVGEVESAAAMALVKAKDFAHGQSAAPIPAADDVDVPLAGSVYALSSMVDQLVAAQNDAAAVRERLEQELKDAREAGRNLSENLKLEQSRQQTLQARLEQLNWQLDMRQRVLGKLRSPAPEVESSVIDRVDVQPSVSGTSSNAAYEFNALQDTRYSHNLPGFEHVCHVMHREWFGIRAASGSLPGQKLAVSGVIPPSMADIEDAIKLLHKKQVKRLVLHGFSTNMAKWARALHAAGFDHISLVWHGAPVMWVHEDERRLFGMALDLARSGVLRRVNGMRAGTHAVMQERYSWAPQIYNMPPNYAAMNVPAARGQAQGATVFAPSWNLVHKNLFTNVAAAAAAPEVDSIWIMADDFQLPYPVDKAFKRLPKMDQKGMMDAMSLCDAVMNASIVDCHPMVELEALAAGTPAIRGRLGMDALEDHPYVHLTQVNDPLSVADVRNTLQRVLHFDKSELREMMADYSKAMVKLSFDRYVDFLEA